MIGIITLVLLAIGLYLVFFVFFPLGRGAIYDPSSYEETRLIAEVAAVTPGERAADLGSGDGRVLIALAHRGAEAHGYEINPILVALSRRNIRAQGLRGKAFVHWGSFWRRDLGRYDLITVFQVGFVMGRLEAKLRRELSRGARIVSHYWRFPTLRPEAAEKNIYRYRIG
jgi:cyclopropane fatty-acyl-phospholipid synthase-like methyltransferase